MSETDSPATSGMKAVALFIVWGSFAQFDGKPLDPPDTLYNGAVYLTAITGIITAIGIWTNAAWMIYAYGAWFVLMVVTRVWHDALIEPVLWKVVLGALIVVALFGLIGLFLYRDQRQRSVQMTSEETS